MLKNTNIQVETKSSSSGIENRIVPDFLATNDDASTSNPAGSGDRDGNMDVSTTQGKRSKRNHSCSQLQVSNSPPRRTVSFCESVNLRYHISIADMTQAEIDAYWLSEDDFRAIRHSCCKEIARMERHRLRYSNDSSCDSSSRTRRSKKFTERGLEGLVHNRARVKSMLREAGWNAVLEEEDRFLSMYPHEEERLLDLGICREEAIRKAYLPMSLNAQRLAHAVGLQDQSEALRANA